LPTPLLLHFALGRGFEIAQRFSLKIFLDPVEDQFIAPLFSYGAPQHNFKGRG
jgi:hypothetical protein